MSVLGRNLVPIIQAFFKKGDPVQVTVNENGGEWPGKQSAHDRFVCIPEACPQHAAEYERSKENQKNIATIDREMHELKIKLFKKLDFQLQGQAVILRALVRNNMIEEKDIPKEVM